MQEEIFRGNPGKHGALLPVRLCKLELRSRITFISCVRSTVGSFCIGVVQTQLFILSECSHEPSKSQYFTCAENRGNASKSFLHTIIFQEKGTKLSRNPPLKCHWLVLCCFLIYECIKSYGEKKKVFRWPKCKLFK